MSSSSLSFPRSIQQSNSNTNSQDNNTNNQKALSNKTYEEKFSKIYEIDFAKINANIADQLPDFKAVLEFHKNTPSMKLFNMIISTLYAEASDVGLPLKKPTSLTLADEVLWGADNSQTLIYNTKIYLILSSNFLKAIGDENFKDMDDLINRNKLINKKLTVKKPSLYGLSKGTPLMFAVSMLKLNVVAFLLFNGANANSGNPLHLAVKKGYYEIAKQLAQQKQIDLNAKDENGDTALLLALKSNPPNKKMLKLLLNLKADPNIPNKTGFTPLGLASFNGFIDGVKSIVHKTEKIDAPAYKGLTPLMLAAGKGHADVAEFLLANGADPKIASPSGLTALHIASLNQKLDVLALLIDKVNINARNEKGETALMLAIFQNKLASVEFLLKNKADATIIDNSGGTALSYAKEKNNPEIILALKEHLKEHNALEILSGLKNSKK